MKEFKFFQKGTTDMLDGGETFITASFNDDTPEGVMNRRILYHTNPDLYNRVQENEFIRRQIEREREEYLTFFSPITVTKVNPKWWMKIKIFFQEMKIKMYIQDNEDMFGVIFFAAAVTICFGLIIGKILNVW